MPSAEDAMKHLQAEHQFGEIVIIGDDGKKPSGKNYLVAIKTEAEWVAGQYDRPKDGRHHKWKRLVFRCDKCKSFWTPQCKKVTILCRIIQFLIYLGFNLLWDIMINSITII